MAAKALVNPGEKGFAEDMNAKVDNVSDETIDGVKTFSAIPELPAADPTTDNQAARKLYVDKTGLLQIHTAGDVLVVAANTMRGTVATSYTKVKEITLGMSGTLRIKFDLTSESTNIGYGRIYKNGVAVGSEYSVSDGEGTYQTITEDISGWAVGDKLQLYCKSNTGSYDGRVKNLQIYVKTLLPTTTVDID